MNASAMHVIQNAPKLQSSQADMKKTDESRENFNDQLLDEDRANLCKAVIFGEAVETNLGAVRLELAPSPHTTLPRLCWAHPQRAVGCLRDTSDA
eukprot:6138989-Amphidinium_carterae.1